MPDSPASGNHTIDQNLIRNFCIIAHIDHGKSTLSDRLLEYTKTIPLREMSNQVLDQMDLEREKGITIKAKAVRMMYRADDGRTYELNLIDTPGHVDFTYEVSRALAACEGAILVVDASQGVEAQTLANVYMALDYHLTIIPVINKIDLASARPDQVAQEIRDLFGIPKEQMIQASAKKGIGTDMILVHIVKRILPPTGSPSWPTRALIFDSHYDPYKGVVAYVRVVDGGLRQGQSLLLMAEGTEVEALEVGIFRPHMTPTGRLGTGEVGYVATGLKSVRDCSVGDTITSAERPASEALPGYAPAKPMVFAGLYPVLNEEYGLLRDALEKLHLNDAALSYEPETSQALSFGFRCGFLGLLHMEIVQQRLEREYGLDLIATAPSVGYEVKTRDGDIVEVRNPAQLPAVERIEEIREPWMRIDVYTPKEYIGPIMRLIAARRGQFDRMEYLDERRALLKCHIPLSEMVVDFYDKVKACSRGYASLDYEFAANRSGDLIRLDVLVNREPVDALSVIVHRDQAYARGQALVSRLKQLIPTQLFDIAIQASVGSRVIARANIKARHKDVLEKVDGGDVTRKRKLLEKQRRGKRRLKRLGNVQIPQEAFLSALKLGNETGTD
jgi:GTP-binding protein LepA